MFCQNKSCVIRWTKSCVRQEPISGWYIRRFLRQNVLMKALSMYVILYILKISSYIYQYTRPNSRNIFLWIWFSFLFCNLCNAIIFFQGYNKLIPSRILQLTKLVLWWPINLFDLMPRDKLIKATIRYHNNVCFIINYIVIP